jgi:UPF0716 protein FxsA
MIGERGLMHPLKMIALGLLVLPAAEIAAFMFLAILIGFWATFGLLILISLAGMLILRRVGSGAVTRLQTAAGKAKVTGVTLDSAGMATTLGGIFLVIPGFITGLLGAMVIFPMSRHWILTGLQRLISADRRSTGPQIIDLAPDEWQPLPEPKLPPRKRRSKG